MALACYGYRTSHRTARFEPKRQHRLFSQALILGQVQPDGFGDDPRHGLAQDKLTSQPKLLSHCVCHWRAVSLVEDPPHRVETRNQCCCDITF